MQALHSFLPLPVIINNALISVYNKEGLEPLVRKLHSLNVNFFATGGTYDFIKKLNIPVTAVEDVTSYPSILGGRVKTLHPKIFGGILGRRENEQDIFEMDKFEIPPMDLVVVDLYPFEKTVASGATHEEIIEKIDIGGVSLIRAAAKNYKDVLVVSSVNDYEYFLHKLEEDDFAPHIRKHLASLSFANTSGYDTAIFNYLDGGFSVISSYLKLSYHDGEELRYGENPHQAGAFFGKLKEVFTQLNGKGLSYNNLLDCDAALNLIAEFIANDGATVAIIKHNNACGVATRPTTLHAWKDALAGDPVSAFGGVIVCNAPIDEQTAREMHSLFFEVLIAPSFDAKALALLTEKKNRIILQLHTLPEPKNQVRSALNGVLVQEKDTEEITPSMLQQVTDNKPSSSEIEDLLFANKLVRNTKSNAIILAKNKQLLGSGAGQTSRVDALNQAISKAKHFGFDLLGAVMASDAFFPFPDCVEIAHKAGITAVIQPGGSIKDKESIDYCNKNNISMVLTGKRHFKH